MRAKLLAAGFEVEYQTEFMSWIFPLVWMGRRLNRYRQRYGLSDMAELTEADFRIIPGLNALLDRALGGEAKLIQNRRRISLGVSLLAVARKTR